MLGAGVCEPGRWHGHARIEAVRHDNDDDPRVSNVRHSFPEFGDSARTHVVTSFLKRKVFYESIRSIVRMGGKGGDNSFSRVLTRSGSLFFFLNEVGLLRRHIKHVVVWRT